MQYWEDFTVGMVMEFGGYETTEEEIIDFAREFDPQPFHIDKEAARDHYFGGIIASGWHTGAMCMRMMADNYLKDSASMGSPGIDQIRWKKPVRPGETLYVRAEVLDRSLPKSRPELGYVKLSHTVSNQAGEIKMTMVSSGIFRRDPARLNEETGQ